MALVAAPLTARDLGETGKTSLTRMKRKVNNIFATPSAIDCEVFVIMTLYPTFSLLLYHYVRPALSAAEALSGESGDEMDSSCGEEEDVHIPVKPKPLQARHSLLDKLDEANAKANSEPKRQKRDDNMVSSPLIM